MTSGGPVKLTPGKGKGSAGPVPVKVSVQDVISQIRAKFDITDEEALYIKQVTEEKIADPDIRTTVQVHRDDRMYLEGPYRGQVNGEIQTTYDARGRYDELADPKYTDIGGIFDINGANEILNIRVISIGLIDRTPVHPREVFADALVDRASAVIVAHNHPTGSLEPLPSDAEVTKQLKAAGDLIGITLLDHIIFNRNGYFSFLERGKL
jgi:hypothetical protein